MEPLAYIGKRRNWVAWLEEQSRPKEPTPFEKYKAMCVDIATEIGEKYHMDLAEVMIGPESLHVYYRKGSKLYLNIIPRALIIKTCKITPHLEKAVRLQLFRQKKRDKQREEKQQQQTVLSQDLNTTDKS